MALAIARLFEGPRGQRDYTFHNADKLALTSILCFAFGAFLGRIGDKIGCKTRLWLMLGTFVQSLFTMAAALTIWRTDQARIADGREDPFAFLCIVFMSMSLGLQGIMGKRIDTQFSTTSKFILLLYDFDQCTHAYLPLQVVLTTTWCELMTEPNLFKRGYYPTREHKIFAIVGIFVGGFTGRCLIDQVGSAGTLGVGTGIRFLIALSWFFVPSKVVQA